MFLGALFPRKMVTLADLSERGSGCDSGGGGGGPGGHHHRRRVQGGSGSGGTRNAARGEGGRCFKRVHLCRLKNRDDKASVTAARRLVEAYRDEIQRVSVEG